MNSSAEILEQLKSQGHKFTGKRKTIIEFFLANLHRYVTAKEVCEAVRLHFPRTSFDTVYRTIALLLEQKVIEKMEFNDEVGRYRIACDGGHHHHVVCLGCGYIRTLENCPMEQMFSGMESFQIVSHRFEAYGYCSDCAATLAAERSAE